MSIFESVHETLSQQEVSYLLIGGFALGHYGASRRTADVDFLLNVAHADLVEKLFVSVGYEKLHRDQLILQLRNTNVSFMDLDFLFVDGQTIDGILKDAQTTMIKGKLFKVPSLQHLIALKLHAMMSDPRRKLQDMADIVALLRANVDFMTEKELTMICEHYGSSGLSEELIREWKS